MPIDASTTVEQLRAATVVSSDGSTVGRVGEVYLGDSSDRPEWVTVRTGLFGTTETFVPLADAASTGDEIRVPYSKDMVKDAPRTKADGQISVEEEDSLFSYYGIGQGRSGRHLDDRQPSDRQPSDRQPGDRQPGDQRLNDTGRDTSGPTTDDAMTRSEERLHVGTERRESGRARLRKHIVTEHQSVQVPTSHEEVTVEREAITDANRGAATAGAQLSEEEHEVVLHEEVPVVSRTVEAQERVRLGTRTEHETQQVSADVRKEQVDVDPDAALDLDADAERARAGRDAR